MKLKFCGLQSEDDILAVNAIHPDFAGFVFARGSKRALSEKQARRLSSLLDPKIRKVGVFVDQDPAWIVHLVDEGIIDLIQLHGSESEEQVRTLQKSAPVIRAFVIQSAEDLIRASRSCADLILLDAGRGDGKSFDWNLLEDFQRTYLLAGGLSLENIQKAAALHPWGVDVSSGIETDRKKDPVKMAALAAAVRKAIENQKKPAGRLNPAEQRSD